MAYVFLRHIASYLDSQTQPAVNEAYATRELRHIDLRIPSLNLASGCDCNSSWIGCWLDLRRMRCGNYGNAETALMHFSIEATQPSNIEVDRFQVSLTFSALNSQRHDWKLPTMTTRMTANTAPQQRAVWLLEKPSPSQPITPDHLSGRLWSFRSFRSTSCTGGEANTAHWEWKATKDGLSISECGDLYCGVVLQYHGHPAVIKYRIEGSASGKVGCQSLLAWYRRPYLFDSDDGCMKTALWLLSLPPCSASLTHDEIQDFDREVLERHSPGTNLRTRDTRLTYKQPELSGGTIPPSSILARRRTYGRASIGGMATVIMGDVTLTRNFAERKPSRHIKQDRSIVTPQDLLATVRSALRVLLHPGTGFVLSIKFGFDYLRPWFTSDSVPLRDSTDPKSLSALPVYRFLTSSSSIATFLAVICTFVLAWRPLKYTYGKILDLRMSLRSDRNFAK